MTNQRFFSIFKPNIFLIKNLVNAALIFEFTNELPIQAVPRIELVDLLMVVIFCIMVKSTFSSAEKGLQFPSFIADYGLWATHTYTGHELHIAGHPGTRHH